MPLTLTTPTPISGTIDTINLRAVTIDFENRRLHVAYDEVDGTTVINRDKLLTIENPEYNAFWTDFEAKARPTKRRDLRRTLFEVIRDNAGRAGTIDDSAD